MKDNKDKYEPPQAMRLTALDGGTGGGWYKPAGNSDADICHDTGSNAGNWCDYDGSNADYHCWGPGTSATSECYTGGSD